MNTYRIPCLLLCCTLLLLTASCVYIDSSKESDGNAVKPTTNIQETSFIKPHDFTHEEEDFISLVCNGDTISIFNFFISNDIKSISVWWEEYDNGQLSYSSLESKINIDQNSTGKIAIAIDDNDFEIIVKQESSNGIGNTYTKGDVMQVSSNSLATQTEIIADSEIGLTVYALSYDEHNEHYLQVPNYYIDNPERLSDFDTVYLFMCRFSEEAVNPTNSLH